MKTKRQHWSRHIVAAKSEAKGLKAYATRNGLSLASLYYWQRKLQLEATPDSMTQSDTTDKTCGKFVALRINDPAWVGRQVTGNCTLILAGDIRLEMAQFPDPQWLAALERCTHGAR